MVFNCLCCCQSSYKSFFCLYQHNKSSESKVKFRRASNRCERIPQDDKVGYANKIKAFMTSQKPGSREMANCWRIAQRILKNGESAILFLFSASDVLSSASDKAKLLDKNIYANSNVDKSVNYLPVFSSRTYLRLHYFFVTPKAIKKLIELVLKNCEPELLNMSL